MAIVCLIEKYTRFINFINYFLFLINSLIRNILCFLAPFKPLSPYVSCNPNYERCPGEEVCIPLSKFCDNKKDCYLGGDETSCNGKAFFCSC